MCGCIWLGFCILLLLLTRFTHRNLCCISISMMKHHKFCISKVQLWIIHGSPLSNFVDYEYRMVDEFWACRLITQISCLVFVLRCNMKPHTTSIHVSNENENPNKASTHDILLRAKIRYVAFDVQDWSPRMSFILKGSQVSALQLKGWFKSKTSIQEYRNEIQNSC